MNDEARNALLILISGQGKQLDKFFFIRHRVCQKCMFDHAKNLRMACQCKLLLQEALKENRKPSLLQSTKARVVLAFAGK